MAERSGQPQSNQKIVTVVRKSNEDNIQETEEWVVRLQKREEQLKWITFDCRIDEPKKNLERWLYLNNPERAHSEKDDVAWIVIRGRKYTNNEDSDLNGLSEEWEQITETESGESINSRLNFQFFAALGKKYNVLSGKWLVWPPLGATEEIWNVISAYNIAFDGKLPDAGCFTAKVSPVVEEKKGHVICIYNSDFTNKSQVMAVEKAFRSIFNQAFNMTYKPDIFTYCGIYGRNKYRTQPFIYKSRWDKEAGTFRVTSPYQDD